MEIVYSRAAVKALARMEKKTRDKIRQAISGLALRPPVGDVKPMEGKPEGRYRLRVGGYRVIFRYDEQGAMVVLFVIDIGPRGDIYK